MSRSFALRAFLALALATLAPAAGRAASPPQPPVIQEVSWHPYGLVLKATHPLKPQIFTLNAPYRFVVDLPHAEFADTGLSQTIPVHQNGIEEVRMAPKGGGAVRLVVDCSQPVNLQVMQPGDRDTLVLALAGVNFKALTALLSRAQQYAGGGQEIREVWARAAGDALTLDLKSTAKLTYTMFEADPDHLEIRVPGGHLAALMPAATGPLAGIKTSTKNGELLLDVALRDGFYRLDAKRKDPQDLQLSWKPAAVHEFPGRPLIIIDPGHGGADPGAIGPAGTPEKRVCLALAKVLQHALRAHRFNAVLTRSVDTELWLQPRLDLIDQLKANLFISLHANSNTTPDSVGVETYWRNPPDEAFAEAVQKRVAAALKRPDRGVKQERLFVLRNPRVPSLLLESGFISNPNEEMLLSDPDFQRVDAEAIVAGVEDYLHSAHQEAAAATSQQARAAGPRPL